MCYVEVKQSDDRRSNSDYLDMALKELKRKMKKENILQELKKKEHHLPPSMKRKLKRQEAIKRLRRDEIRQNRPKPNKN